MGSLLSPLRRQHYPFGKEPNESDTIIRVDGLPWVTLQIRQDAPLTHSNDRVYNARGHKRLFLTSAYTDELARDQRALEGQEPRGQSRRKDPEFHDEDRLHS